MNRLHNLATRFVNHILRLTKESTEPTINRPWDAWELDSQFFQALFQWTSDNPEKHLGQILDDIRSRIENFHGFLQIIPANPFPAQSLMIALAHLLKLGVTVRRAQWDVQEFAKNVVQWVELVNSLFKSTDGEEFTRRAWRDLTHMRELVDEICLWAVERSNDERWLQISHGLVIQKEIGEFIERLVKARTLLQDLSAINTARGLDVIMTKLRKVVLNQRTISGEIQALQETRKNQLHRITSGMKKRKQEAERERYFARTLDVHAITSPTYECQGKRPCDFDTRVDVLDNIRKWRNDIKRGSQSFLWLTGNPGCGKSAVAASFAQECKDEGVLWAQVFINRNNNETTDPRSYLSSIARQLADYSPEVARVIHRILVQQRSFANNISADRAAYLLASAIRKASSLDPDRPIVIVIDGLDETKRERLEDAAKIFSMLFTTLRSRGNVKVLISSRTENRIEASFIRPTHEKHLNRVHLDIADPSAIQDVSLYIKRNLLKIVQEHGLDWGVWLGDKRSQALGDRASGLFIWAVTTVEFIRQEIHSNGSEGLDDVLNMLIADVPTDITALYALILVITHGAQQSKWELENFRRIFGTIVSLQEPLCINDLAILLDLRKEPSRKPVDIVHFVRRFRALLTTGTDAIDGKTIPRIHDSVVEFITSNSVDAKFRVNLDHAHLELGIQCLTSLGTARKLGAEDSLPFSVRYASRFWSFHLRQTNVLAPTTVWADCRLWPSPSLPLLRGIVQNEPITLQYSLSNSQIQNEIGIWDTISGLSVPHTNVIIGVAFSPDGKQIVSCSHDRTIRVWDLPSRQWLRSFVKHSSEVYAIALSSGGGSFVTGSDDGVIHLWDYFTGVPIGQPLRGHKGSITCVAFSPDGGRIVSGSFDKTYILWDVRNRRATRRPWRGHKSYVRQVVFSSSGRRVCSIDRNGYFIVWNVSIGQKISHMKYGGYPWCLSFSPTDDDVIAVGGEVGIEIRSHSHTWTIPDSEDTRCLSFSSDGKQIIFSSHDTISVAEIGKDDSTARIVRTRSFPRADYMFSPTFSPKLDHFVYAGQFNAVHLFSLHHTKTSLQVVPIDTRARAKLAPNINGATELNAALTNIRKAQHINDVVRMTNRRLKEIVWYEVDSLRSAGESALQACVVRDDFVIAGYKDGSALVWEWHGVDENKKQSRST